MEWYSFFLFLSAMIQHVMHKELSLKIVEVEEYVPWTGELDKFGDIC